MLKYLALLCLYFPTLAQAEEFHWPENARAAVVMGYDDALASQLDIAAPQLEAAGFRGTFYLTLASPIVYERMDEWRALAARGHELGNHTIYHPCTGGTPDRDWVAPHNDLRTRSVAQMVDEVNVANSFLHAIDGRRERTLTIPCGEPLAGGEDYVASVADQFVAVRRFVPSAIAQSKEAIDPKAVGVYPPVDVNAERIIDFIEAAAERGTVANLLFHGIGGEYLSVSAEVHQEVVNYLLENQEDYWVDTMINVYSYVEANRGTSNAEKGHE